MYLAKNHKSPYYQVVYFINGKRTTISTKTTDKRIAQRFLNNFSPPLFNESAIKDPQKSISLKIFKEEYIDYCKQSKSKSYVDCSIIPAFKKLEIFIGDIPLKNISSRILDQFIKKISSYSISAAALYYRTIKAAFNKAVAWEYISENPFKNIKAPKVAKTLPIYISVTEFQLILGNTSEPFLKDLFLTAFYTGMRLGELLNMKWEWIDLSQNIITIKNSRTFITKSKKERIIPICTNLRDTFLNILPKYFNISYNEYIFTRIPGIKLNGNYVSKQFKKVVRKVGLNDKIHFHSLRHSFASILVQRGVSLYVVKELLGHEDLSTTQIYSHLQKQNLVDAVNII